MATIPPDRIECERLLLRAWTAADAPLFKWALDASLPELRQWIPWAVDEPSPLTVLEERLQGYHDDLHGGRDALYALMDHGETEVLGAAGLYRRPGLRDGGHDRAHRHRFVARWRRSHRDPLRRGERSQGSGYPDR